MNINYRESQTSLFPEAATSPTDIDQPHFMAARLTLSVENLVILAIVSIMVVLFAFSIGVEQGKRVVLRGASPSGIVEPQASVPAAGGIFGGARSAGKSEEPKAADVTTAVPQPEKMKAEASGSRPAPSGAYTVQVASYKTEKSAQREAETLKQKGYRDVFVMPKGSYVILCVGDFGTKDEASLFGKSKLKSRYQDFRVRSL